MGLTEKLISLCGFLLSLTVPPAYAQLGSGQQDAASIINGMPPDVLAKVRSLAQILQQGLKEGKISDAEIQQGLTSGKLGEKLKQLGPEAGQLLDEITDASRQGKGPGEESLMPLMGGLGISPN
jgi:phage tail tape-measure protein